MRILFLGLNYRPEEIGIGVYSGGLCEALAARGHDVRVIAGKPYYPNWSVRSDQGYGWRRSREDGVDIIRCPLYVPARPSGIRRIIHHLSFALSALVPMVTLAVRYRPDLIVTVAPSMAAAPVALLAARIARVRTWLHVQDFEVEAAFAMGLLDRRSRLAQLARYIERGTIARFDEVSSIGPAMCRKIVEFGVASAHVYERRNWADLDTVTPSDQSNYRRQWRIAAPIVALYSGNIANKQGIEIVLDAARKLAHRQDIAFVICGEGPTRAGLEAQAAEMKNLSIHDLQPRERLSDLLALATIHLLPQRAEAADLVLPSKLTNMLASGRPIIVTAAEGTGLADEVATCGIRIAPGDAVAFARAVESLADDPARCAALGKAARQRAEERWAREQIIDGFEMGFMAAAGQKAA